VTESRKKLATKRLAGYPPELVDYIRGKKFLAGNCNSFYRFNLDFL